MSPSEQLHAMIKDIIADDPPELIADKCGVRVAIARRWRGRASIAAPSFATMQRLFNAYAVELRAQRRAMGLWHMVRGGVTHAD